MITQRRPAGRGNVLANWIGVAAAVVGTAAAPAQTPATQTSASQAPPAQSPPPRPPASQTTSDAGRTAGDAQVPGTGLDIPANLQIFGKFDPNVRKATAIVNDSVITGTDVDQRVALIVAANNIDLAPGDRDRLKLQVLRQLIDETLEIQEAKSHDIEVSPDEIAQSFERVGRNFQKTPREFTTFLKQQGSSERSIKRQIEGELAWSRYLRRRIEPQINVGEAEVKAILARLEAAKGTEEYHLKEIYKATEGNDVQATYASANQILDQVKGGKTPFEVLARNFSDSPSKIVGGDLDWIRLNTLPDPLAKAAQEMQVGQVAGPIEVPGGFSILYLVDKRQVLTADPRDARLNLKQLTVRFPTGTSQAEATARASVFAKTVQGIQGCGAVDKTAQGIGAEVVNNDTVRIRDLPPQLQEILLKLQVGQATPPFGSPQEGVRALVLCGRDDPQTGQLPNAEAVQDQIQQQRVNLRAQQTLRDLRRDAIIEYR